MKKFEWTERQKRALRGSIKKWEKIVDGTGVDNGRWNCSCCIAFDKYGHLMCEGCPISIFTGTTECRNTPYAEYVRRFYKGLPVIPSAKKELSFIKKVYKAGGGT